MVAMVLTMAEKVEHDQRVAGNFGRTGENRTRRPNGTELDFSGIRSEVASRAVGVNRSSLLHRSLEWEGMAHHRMNNRRNNRLAWA